MADLKKSTVAALYAKYKSIANTSPQWYSSPEFKEVSGELKRRGLKTFGQIESAVREEGADPHVTKFALERDDGEPSDEPLGDNVPDDDPRFKAMEEREKRKQGAAGEAKGGRDTGGRPAEPKPDAKSAPTMEELDKQEREINQQFAHASPGPIRDALYEKYKAVRAEKEKLKAASASAGEKKDTSTAVFKKAEDAKEPGRSKSAEKTLAGLKKAKEYAGKGVIKTGAKGGRYIEFPGGARRYLKD